MYESNGGRRAFLRTAAGFALVPLLIFCGTRYDGRLRYRMTVEVRTPRGLRTGSGVLEVRAGSWLRGQVPSLRGQAVPVDLPDGQTLYAVLSRPDLADFASHIPYRVFTKRMPDLLGTIDARNDANSIYEQLHRRRPVAILEGDELPMVVWFRNPADPKSVEMVTPQRPMAPGTWVQRIWIAITDDEITTGLERRLPWLPDQAGSLDYDEHMHPEAPEKDLNRYSFSRGLL